MKATVCGLLYCRAGAVVEGPAWCELAWSQLEPAEVPELLDGIFFGEDFGSSFFLSNPCDFTSLALALARCFLPALALAFGTLFFQSALELWGYFTAD